MISIGALARGTGVKVPTIRYYEQLGLIDAPERSMGNQRRYGAAHLERLSFIRHARDLGLSIRAIRDLIRISTDPDQPCADADTIASEHLKSVREKITRLKRLEVELARIATGCHNGRVGDCYVIRSLADHGLCRDRH